MFNGVISSFEKNEKIEAEKKNVLQEISEIMTRYMNNCAVLLVDHVRSAYPSVANDDSIIYEICKKYGNVSEVVNHINSIQKIGQLNSQFYEIYTLQAYSFILHDEKNMQPFLLNVFGGEIPKKSNLLKNAEAALDNALKTSASYPVDKKRRLRYSVCLKGFDVHPLSAEDFRMLKPYELVLREVYDAFLVEPRSSITKKQRVDDAIE